MKTLFSFGFFCFLGFFGFAQFTNENIYKTAIANINSGTPSLIQSNLNQLSFDRLISQQMNVSHESIQLQSARIANGPGNDWYLQYTFKHSDLLGVYAEKLFVRNSQLMITEYREAKIATVGNCQNISINNENLGVTCLAKIDNSREATIKYILINSVN